MFQHNKAPVLRHMQDVLEAIIPTVVQGGEPSAWEMWGYILPQWDRTFHSSGFADHETHLHETHREAVVVFWLCIVT